MIKVRAILLIFGLIFLLSCGKEESKKTSVIKTQIVDGVKHVYNPSQPLKGVVQMEVEKIFQIDPDNVDTEKTAHFFRFEKDKTGNIYIFDYKNFKIYKFSKDGKFLTCFLEKGEGPGEFILEPKIEFSGNDTWLHQGRKVGKFDSDGNFIEERRLKRNYRKMQIVDENRFIGIFNKSGEEKETNAENGTRISGLMGKEENVLSSFLEAENIGYTFFKGEPPFRVYFPLISPDIIHVYSHERGLVYIVLSTEYKIFVKTLRGDTKLVIYRDHQKKILDEEDRKKIIAEFRSWPEALKMRLKANLPETICIFRFVRALPNGYIGLVRYRDASQEAELDIFDPEGRFIYTVRPSEEITNFIKVSFYKNKRVGTLKSIDDKDVYVEYRVKNLLGLFEN